MAARALITLFRSVNPQLLHSKDRGRQLEDAESSIILASNTNKNIEFGALKAVDFVPGSEVLSEETPAPVLEKRQTKRKRRHEKSSDEEDSDSEWVDIVSSGSIIFH